jgi:RHS repeat-associated protein
MFGSYQCGVRLYFPALGRFCSKDPLYLLGPSQQAFDPRQLDLYGYARSNPVRFIDPTGMDAAEVALDVAGIFDPTPASDLASAGLAWSRGDKWGAAASALGVVPILGDALGKGFKILRHSYQLWKGSRIAKAEAKIVGRVSRGIGLTPNGQPMMRYGKPQDIAMQPKFEAPEDSFVLTGHGSRGKDAMVDRNGNPVPEGVLQHDSRRFGADSLMDVHLSCHSAACSPSGASRIQRHAARTGKPTLGWTGKVTSSGMPVGDSRRMLADPHSGHQFPVVGEP